jgi:hypothetical protein
MTHEEMKKAEWVCVLGDDDTFSGLDGSWIAMVPTDHSDELAGGGKVSDLPEQFCLRKLIDKAIDAGWFDEE